MASEIDALKYWLKYLLDLIDAFGNALEANDINRINNLNEKLDDFQYELFCDDVIEKNTLIRVLNNIGLIICGYDDHNVREKLNRYKKYIVRFYSEVENKSAQKKINKIRGSIFPVGKKMRSGQKAFEVKTTENTEKKVNCLKVSVFFGTNRGLTRLNSNECEFANNRGSVSYGLCVVSIPKKHIPGNIESPSFYRLELNDNPQKHITLLEKKIFDAFDFWSNINTLAVEKGISRAFVFIHGFRMSFESAAKRMAQMAYDLNFEGIPFFFSWPSRNNIIEYLADKEASAWSIDVIADFLVNIADKQDFKQVYIIAHSMGGECVIKAIEKLRNNSYIHIDKFREIILAAPDIDAQLFSESIAPKILRSDSPLTLYVSSKDRALKISKKFNKCDRLGSSEGNIVILSGLETIDAGAIDMSYIGHSYFGDEYVVLKDICSLINNGLRPNNRSGLMQMNYNGAQYWSFAK